MESFELKRILGEYGADFKTIEGCFMGDYALYERCLKMFFSEKNMDLLEKTMSYKDYLGAFEAAHALKGLTGNLGLTRLYKVLCDLVESLRVGGDNQTDARYQKFKEELFDLQTLFSA